MNTGIIKLADFGWQDRFRFRQGVTHMKWSHCGMYRSPEILLGARFYSTAVDIWSLACIFAETIRGSPLFDGDSEIDQLFRIFRVLGTPTPTIWPGVEKFPDYKADFPKWNATDLRRCAPAIDDDGLDLLEMMLAYPPMERITAKAALCHRYLLNVPISTALPDISTLFSKT
uniref:cyclin-dependent kinase n=1 Tax=Ditylenchus dipsaci TaxID=166011 RepID=A0A915DRT0_9BILA